jgi:hypothetical protein
MALHLFLSRRFFQHKKKQTAFAEGFPCLFRLTAISAAFDRQTYIISSTNKDRKIRNTTRLTFFSHDSSL